MNEPTPLVAVSNYAYVIKTFLDNIERQFPDVAFVYDEQLTYETAVAAFRRNENISGGTDAFLPAFSFRRNVLRWREEGSGRRSTVCSALDRIVDGDSAFRYKMISGTLDLEFQFYETVAEELEKFEMIYLSDSLLNREHILRVPIPEVSTFEYQVKFEALESKIFNVEQNYYKAVQGLVRISGMFLLFEGTSPIIKQIQIAVRDFNTSVAYCSHTITPVP